LVCAIGFAVLASVHLALAAPRGSVDVVAVQRAIAQQYPDGLPAASGSTTVKRTSAATARFYALRGYAPAWLGANGPRAAADVAIAELRAAHAHGLKSDDYGSPPIADALDGTLDRSPADAARADIALTAAFLGYLSDLQPGRITAAQLEQAFGPNWWKTARPALSQVLAGGRSLTALEAARMAGLSGLDPAALAAVADERLRYSAPDAPPPAPKPDYKYMQGDKKKRHRKKK
jgi:hypothetical protein